MIVSPGNTNLGELFTPTAGEIPVNLMTYGFGRSDGVKSESLSLGGNVERIPKARGNKNLVLLEKPINKSKGTWFEKKKINIKWQKHKGQDKSRTEVRRVSTKSLPGKECHKNRLTEEQKRA